MFKWPNVSVFLCLYAGLAQVSSFVSPLTDINVRCHNFENIVYWNYGDPQLQPEFTVTIKSYLRGPQPDLKTTQTYLNISNYTLDPSDVYFVYVKAQLKGSEDYNASEIIFTYNQDSPLGIKCMVDFPSVNVSVLQHTIEVAFEHPYDVYDIETQSDDVFKYTVKCNETACGKYECTESCTAVIPIPESLYESCFYLHFNGVVNSIPFEGLKEVCSLPKKDPTLGIPLITGIVCAAVVLLLLLIGVGVEIYKKVTGSDSQRAIISKLLGMVSSDPSVIEPERPDLSEVRSVSHTPLLVTPEYDISTPTPNSPEEVTHLPIQSITDFEFPGEEEEQKGSEEDNDFVFSNEGYDRKKFPFEMSPGDIVEAYRP
ncbi:growth/differentiation factor 10b [Salminus brasiliensis]|uniref:growth/differentiation factor 10b n=1 Tax=Salminus brasiliensis TaxID=930266 RepID=UPI003B837037